MFHVVPWAQACPHNALYFDYIVIIYYTLDHESCAVRYNDVVLFMCSFDVTINNDSVVKSIERFIMVDPFYPIMNIHIND